MVKTKALISFASLFLHMQIVIFLKMPSYVYAAFHLGLFCLLRGISSKNGIKIQNHSFVPKNESGLVQLIGMG